jgi:arylsulfatase
MAGYYGLVNHVDDMIGFLMQRCFIHGTPFANQPTYIIFASDHGEMLGDHHLFRKVLPYEGSTHVPLFISGKNIKLNGQRSDQLACLEDIAPTILDMAGVAIPDKVDGRSLLPIVQGKEAKLDRDLLYGEHSGGGANHWIIQGQQKYVWFSDTNEEQLFDLATDPGETKDLSGDAAKLEPFRKLLSARLKGRTDYTYDTAKLKPCANGQPAVFWPN